MTFRQCIEMFALISMLTFMWVGVTGLFVALFGLIDVTDRWLQRWCMRSLGVVLFVAVVNMAALATSLLFLLAMRSNP